LPEKNSKQEEENQIRKSLSKNKEVYRRGLKSVCDDAAILLIRAYSYHTSEG
jgi:hypothetical protein